MRTARAGRHGGLGGAVTGLPSRRWLAWAARRWRWRWRVTCIPPGRASGRYSRRTV